MTELVAARHLSKRYGSTTAVADVSLTVAAGEVVCLLGPNGAGKSTTMRMLATLTRPDGGSVRVAGYDATTNPRDVRARIGYIAQHAGTDAYLTGRENLHAQARAQRLGRTVTAARVRELLQLVGLSDAGDRLVHTYSGGMRRRLEIAMGIVHSPQVIFLDEPTTGLDPEARSDLWHELSALSDRQTLSILLTTHYLEEADQLADRIVIIDHGRVITEGTPAELKAQVDGDTVTVTCTGTRSADDRLTDEVVTSIRNRLDPRRLSVDGTTLRVNIDHGNRRLPTIVTLLNSAGIGIESVTVTRPTLDDVYLHHTGRSITDADQPAVS